MLNKQAVPTDSDESNASPNEAKVVELVPTPKESAPAAPEKPKAEKKTSVMKTKMIHMMETTGFQWLEGPDDRCGHGSNDRA